MSVALKVFISDEVNPYVNLAAETALYESGGDGVYLYLWRNERTVVIGRHQNPFTECNLSELAADGGRLLRRTTGGGAVYHDGGNLNFTFIAPTALFDVNKQLGIIADALLPFGIAAEVSGRNDLTAAEGKKFSGNAYLLGHETRLHHGTLLLNTEQAALNRYLLTPRGKTGRRGVTSVASRVINLCKLYPLLTAEALSTALIAAAERAYKSTAERCDFGGLKRGERVNTLAEKYASDGWLYGGWRTFNGTIHGAFCWGSVEIDRGEDGKIESVATDGIYPDAVTAAVAYLNEGTAISDSLADEERLAARDIINLIIKE